MAEVFRRVNGKPIQQLIAMIAPVVEALDREMNFYAQKADGLLNARARQRTGTSQITTDVGRIDRYVVLDDSRGLQAALSIEYGRREAFDPATGEQTQWATEGLWVLHDAFGLSTPKTINQRPARGGDDLND